MIVGRFTASLEHWKTVEASLWARPTLICNMSHLSHRDKCWASVWCFMASIKYSQCIISGSWHHCTVIWLSMRGGGAGRQRQCCYISNLCVLLYCRLVVILWDIRQQCNLQQHHLLCILQFTEISSTTEQKRWCTKIHLFETISKWQFLYRRNIEIKMKQNITDDACIVDFCALNNITMLMPSEISPKSDPLSFFKYGFPRSSGSYSIMWHLRYQMRQQFPVIKAVIEWTMRKLPKVYEFILLVTVPICLCRYKARFLISLLYFL